MTRIISTHSFRGGTGKSNITANLAVMVAAAGNRVGVIDTDIQSPGIHVLFNFDQQRAVRSLNDYLHNRCSIEEAVYDVTAEAFGSAPAAPGGKVLLIPSSISAGEIAHILRAGYDVSLLNDGIQQLIKHLQLDYLFIDTHPGVNEETLLSLAISDVLVLLLRPDNQDFQGTAVTVELARRLEVPEMFFIVNKVPPGTDMQALEQQVSGAFKADVAALLPLNSEIARLASSAVFCTRFPDHPFTHQLRRAAGRLLGIHSPTLA